MPNLRHGIGVLPTAGTTLAELVEQAGRGLGASSSETTGASRTPSARGNAARGLAPQRDGDQLSVLLAEYESGTIPGIAIVPEPGACPVCADAARDAYSPQSLPPLPLAGCGGLDGCRCHYGRPRKDGRGQPPPLPALQQSPSDIPRALHAAALFGQDPKQGCRVQDLATYLDAFALIPFKAELPLQQGEAAYLLRQGRRGRDDGRLGESLDGMPQFPLRGSLARWVAQAPKPPAVPFAAIEFWDPGLLCITNWRIIFGRRGAVESILLSDIKALGYVQGGVCCTVGSRGRRTLFLVADALKIGLCLTRAVRDAVAPVGA